MSQNTNYPPPPGLYPPPPGYGGRSNGNTSGPRPPQATQSYDAYRPPPPSSGYDSWAPPARNDRDRNDRYDRYDSYDRWQPPLPPRPPSPRYDRRGTVPFQPPQSDFTFRVDRPQGIRDASPYDSWRPNDNRSQSQFDAHRGPTDRDFPARPRDRAGPRRDRQRDRDRPRHRDGERIPWQQNRRWHTFVPSDRPILHSTDNHKPSEDFVDSEHGVQYRSIEDLSDSDPADMDISEDSDEEFGEPTAKRARKLDRSSSGDNVPKWSNPDPYVTLPPTEDSDKKRKDVVQLIRKARMQSESNSKLSLPAGDEDFIRCDSDDSDGSVIITSAMPVNSKDTAQPSGSLAAAPSRSSQVRGPIEHAPSTTNGTTHLPPRPALPARPPSPRGGQGPQTSSRKQAAMLEGASKKRGANEVDMMKSSDLGSRKRTHSDELKLPAHAHLKRGTKAPVGGALTAEWMPRRHVDSCPWIATSAEAGYSNVQVNVRLHMEVLDFYEHVRPRAFEDRLRHDLVKNLNRKLGRRYHGNQKMHPFGSFMSGLYLPTADMDLVFLTKKYYSGGPPALITRRELWSLREYLSKDHVAVDDKFEVVPKAKVPLVKYMDKTTGLKVDVSFENMTGLAAIDTFKAWKSQYPAMPILVTVIKQFLLMRGLNEPYNGGIGGFSVICLVVSMLQLMPQVQSGDIVAEHHLGTLLMEFFDLYGNRFNYRTTALRLNPPGYVPKNKVKTFAYKNVNRLSIIDPNNPENDIAGGSSNFETIFEAFSHAHHVMQERMASVAHGEQHPSILEVILGGNYKSFKDQREHLRKLHEMNIGPCPD